MKNLLKTIALAVMILATSCAQEIDTESELNSSRRYNLSFDEFTKTDITGTGSKRHINWSEGDEIKYYTVSKQASAASATVTVSGRSAYVEIPRGRTDEFINAVYGAAQLKSSTSTENKMIVTSPVKANQLYTSFSEAHLCAAFTEDIENPNLQFHNVAAVLKFTSSSAIKKVVIHGNNEEIITGGSDGYLMITYSSGVLTTTSAYSGGTSVTVQTDGTNSDFYVAILPVTFTRGITIDCYDESLYLIVSQKTSTTINTLSSSGMPKIIYLGNAQDWIANPQPMAVDLGLSVKWASYNVGATSPEEYGDYFAWGETTPKNEYNWASYQFGSSKNGPFSKYVHDNKYGIVDHKSVLDLTDDAAHTAWGDDWRLPTKDEVSELMNSSNCTWTWTTKNGVPGYKVTSRKSGYTANSIFLPANGMFGGASLTDAGTIGNYWSASASEENTYHAISPYFSSTYVKCGNCYRYFGLGVRPVQGAVVPVSSIDVSPTLEIVVGTTTTLSASVQPANATYKKKTWSSSDETVATVDASGKVAAVALGQATVTVCSADGKSATCSVTVIRPDYNGHEYVDLGLPSGLKWAIMNVGATKPEEYGDYVAWGETKPYNGSTYKWYNDYNKLTKYCTDSQYWDSTYTVDYNTTLDFEDDAARANWGGSWRMPTNDEWTELRVNCTWTWTTQNGVNGKKVTGPNGNSIFLPAAGYRIGASLMYVGSYGYYWSSSLDNGHSICAMRICFDFDSFDRYFYSQRRDSGLSVRPVSE